MSAFVDSMIGIGIVGIDVLTIVAAWEAGKWLARRLVK